MLNASLSQASRHGIVSNIYTVSPRSPEGELLRPLFEGSGTTVYFAPNDEIFVEEEPANQVYRVAEGVVRICKFTEDGRRQIGEFHFAGDIFGLECEMSRSMCAEAVTRCRIQVMGRGQLLARAQQDKVLANALWHSSCNELRRLREHLYMLGRASAAERVLSFLQETAVRLGTPGKLDVPMSRQDIADHLGLNIETVSRAVTQLRGDGVIQLEGARRVQLNNSDATFA